MASMVRVYAAAFLVATLFAVFTRTFLVQAFAIPSGSMEPGLTAGDHILVNKFIYRGAGTSSGGVAGRTSTLLPQRDVRRGDVVIFARPRSAGPRSAGPRSAGPAPHLIKRCVGLPGETVELASRRLSIDGQPIDERGYLHPRAALPAPGFGPATVPAGHYFCLGDHRDRSRDSRVWGPVAAERLVGRAVLVYWSVRPRSTGAEDGFVTPKVDEAAEDRVAEDGGAWSKMRRLLRLPVDWILRFRWNRCLKPVR